MKHSKSRRTTLTLPSASLDLAERIARERHLNLSSVVGEALQRGLREEEFTRRSESILQAYSNAFAGFSAEELLMLDGIVFEESAPEKRQPKPRRVSKNGREGKR